MIKLPYVFSDNALFLHSAPLDICGTADGKQVTVALKKGGEEIGAWSGACGEDGRFCVTIDTPAASYDAYDMVISDGESEHLMKDVLFGELWLACGQSNMEMANVQQNEWEEMREALQGKEIRAFQQPRLPHDASFPFRPADDTTGEWRCPEMESFQGVSAVATALSLNLYRFLAAGGEKCPVGFINCNRGGTCIETWIPAEIFADYERIAFRTPCEEEWNSRGEGNYQQPAAHYNFHVAPVLGLRARGMLWYQGESNVGMENTRHLYKDYLTALRESYRARFAASADAEFPMISVQLYPWKYTAYNDTYMGYLNMAFSDMARRSPREYPFVPICDLSPIWNKWRGNHPIHPIHKYKIGDRMALLMENIVYGRKVKNVQTLPAVLKSCVRHGNKLRLTFDNVGSGLYVKGQKARGLYIRSRDGAYTPAYYEIVAKNVMNVYHPYIDKPCHVAYAVSSLEPRTNLFAGEFPVTPFCTEFQDGVNNTVRISAKPWLNNENDSGYVGQVEGTYFDFFNRAIFNPIEGSGVCYDSDFAVTARSLRVYALDHNDRRFGAYILASQYATLDLENYSALKFSLYHHHNLTVELVLTYAEKDGTRLTHTCRAAAAEEGRNGWYEHTVDLVSIPEGTIEKAEFRFTRGDGRLSYVFMDDLILVPKQ